MKPSLILAFGIVTTGLPSGLKAADPPSPPILPPVPSAVVQATNVITVRPNRPVNVIDAQRNRPGVITIVRTNPPGVAAGPISTRTVAATAGLLPFAWDADVKQHDARSGETNIPFSFWFTNTSPNEVVLTEVRTTCGCTLAKLPSRPWKIAPGESNHIDVMVDIRGKRGLLAKLVYVYSSGYQVKSLQVRVNIPDDPVGSMADRARNLQIAAADRQAVFRGDCASCHAEPAAGKQGAELYVAVCGICHDAEHRASMVPDLATLKHVTDRAHWQNWVANGKPGTLMPAFSKAQGGPLTDEQVASLVTHLLERFPSAAAPAGTAAGGR